MYEELYIIKDGDRKKIDLQSPSGITLNFKSNFFGDLSKITCSYSYTFKLPLTRNNRELFENAEDIRATSNMVRKRFTAEFLQNGINLFSDANLYISAVQNNEYEAVMTWGVVRGFEALKDNDVSLRELPILGTTNMARYGIQTDVPRPELWSNDASYFIPLRKKESSYIYNGEKYVYGREYGSGSLPVVPVKRIIDTINAFYGTSFYFGESVDGSTQWNSESNSFDGVTGPTLINFGVVPLVKKDLTDEQYAERTGTLTNVSIINNYSLGAASNIWADFKAYNVIGFDYEPPTVNNYYSIGSNGSSATGKLYTFFRKSGALVEKALLDGYIRVSLNAIGSRWNGTTLEYHEEVEEVKLIIYQRKWQLKEGSSTNGEIVYEEAVAITGKYTTPDVVVDGDYRYEYAVYEFDFRDADGRNRLSLDDFGSSSESYPFFMSISEDVREVLEVNDFKIIPDGYMSDSVTSGYEIDIQSNLPDISCMTFVKSLYYMIGAFPIADAEGRIIPIYYSDLYNNIYKHNTAIDWSAKICSAPTKLPEKIEYKVSDLARKNYYLMKNDELENESSSEREDVYESGMGCIICDNETLSKEKTIIQLPYYGAFLQDANRPSVETGNDMKYTKHNDDDTTEFVEAKPAIGIVIPVEECTYETPITDPPTCIALGTYAMLLHIWDGFKKMDEDYSYDCLQTIVRRPTVITETLSLNELDLRDIDYSVPIYLQKYNAYFAIVSITRKRNGVCKCELIKLP